MKLTLLAFCDGCGASIAVLGTDTAWLMESMEDQMRDAIQRHRAATPACPYFDSRVMAAQERADG